MLKISLATWYIWIKLRSCLFEHSPATGMQNRDKVPVRNLLKNQIEIINNNNILTTHVHNNHSVSPFNLLSGRSPRVVHITAAN